MSTRGAITFVVDGEKERIVYNHSDSYPDWLGVRMAQFVASISVAEAVEEMAEFARHMKPVNREERPTQAQAEEIANATDMDEVPDVTKLRVGDEWYWLLHETQGDPLAILKARYFEPAQYFPLDSLFCEWVYVVDFDQEILEVHKGFQREPHDLGRFAKRTRPSGETSEVAPEYYPVKLVAAWSFHDTDLVEEMGQLEKRQAALEDADRDFDDLVAEYGKALATSGIDSTDLDACLAKARELLGKPAGEEA